MGADGGGSRVVTVPAQRLLRWVEGFAERHGQLIVSPTSGGFDLQAADGAVAGLSAQGPLPLPPWPAHDALATPQDGTGVLEPRVLAASVAGHLLTEPEVALLVLRRGGYAAARLRGGAVIASKVGTRYVQSRTAAGGWSQQRFARRRDNQTSGLVGAAVEVAARVLAPGERPAVEVLVTGGDRALVERALADPALRTLAGLPRGPHLALGDPRADVVRAVPAMLRSVRITLTPPR